MGLFNAPGIRFRAHARGAWIVLLAVAALGCCEREVNERLDPSHRQRTSSEAFALLPLPDLELRPLPAEIGPQRVISLIPSVTELIFTLGLGDRLVGRSHWCDWPPEVKKLPDLGRFESFSKERIVDLRPDLLILFASQDAFARDLERNFAIPILMPATESGRQIFEGIGEVARGLGVPERGAKLLEHLESELERVRASVRDKPRVKVLVALDRQPLYVPGRASFVHELLEVAGAENVAALIGGSSAWPTASLEQVFDWQPELIIDLSVGEGREESLREGRRFWGAFPWLRAVENGRVFSLEAGVLVRPGPRMAAAASLLAELIHDE